MSKVFANILLLSVIMLLACSPYKKMSLIGPDGDELLDENYKIITDIANDMKRFHNDEDLFEEVRAYGPKSVYLRNMLSYFNSWPFHKVEPSILPIKSDSRVYLFNCIESKIIFTSNKYIDIYPFSENKAAVYVLTQEQDGTTTKCGYIDEQDSMLIQPLYDSCGSFYNGMAVVGLKDEDSGQINFGVIDCSGNFIILPEYGQLFYNTDGLFPAVLFQDGGTTRSGLINRNSEFVYELPAFEEVRSPINNDTFLVSYPDGYKLIALDGRTIIDYAKKWDDVYPISDNRALVRKGRAYGYVDVTGNIALPFEYSLATPFAKGVAVVKKR